MPLVLTEQLQPEEKYYKIFSINYGMTCVYKV